MAEQTITALHELYKSAVAAGNEADIAKWSKAILKRAASDKAASGLLSKGIGRGAMGLGIGFLVSQLLGDVGNMIMKGKQLSATKETERNKMLADAMLIRADANERAAQRRIQDTQNRRSENLMERMNAQNQNNMNARMIGGIAASSNQGVLNRFENEPVNATPMDLARNEIDAMQVGGLRQMNPMAWLGLE